MTKRAAIIVSLMLAVVSAAIFAILTENPERDGSGRAFESVVFATFIFYGGFFLLQRFFGENRDRDDT